MPSAPQERTRNVIRRIDPVSRAAYGVLCIAAMSLEAIPVLLVVGVVGGIAIAIDGSGGRALGVWAGSWAAAWFATILAIVLSFIFWPLASDWILEWPGYLTALFIGAAGLVMMSLVVFVTDWPLAVELIIPFLLTFVVGFSIPGLFLGLGHPQIQTLEHRREHLARRR